MVQGHICKEKKFYVIEEICSTEEEGRPEEAPMVQVNAKDNERGQSSISLQAMYGFEPAHAIKVIGFIKYTHC